MDQIKSLNIKLDKILKLVEPKAETSIVAVKEETAIISQPKTEKAIVSKKKAKEKKVDAEILFKD